MESINEIIHRIYEILRVVISRLSLACCLLTWLVSESPGQSSRVPFGYYYSDFVIDHQSNQSQKYETYFHIEENYFEVTTELDHTQFYPTDVWVWPEQVIYFFENGDLHYIFRVNQRDAELQYDHREHQIYGDESMLLTWPNLHYMQEQPKIKY